MKPVGAIRSTAPATGTAPAAAPETGSLLLPLAAVLALMLLHAATLLSMADTWLHSATFAHGVLVIPISAWLAWRERHTLAILPRAPSGIALAPLALLGMVWLLASLSFVQVVAQYALMLMVPCLLAAMAGWPFVRALAFPLGYLLLAVPCGEFLIPPLVDFTAAFTVAVLQLAGIPVYREASFLTLPTGNWAVAEACSGLRYLIASFALGTLYAYRSYRSPARRLAFVAVSLLLPVLANGVRAATIVVIGHWSDMNVAAGIDHLVYGWVFFGVVLLLLFWCGAFWRDSGPPPARLAAVGDAVRPPFSAAAAALLLAAAWPLLGAGYDRAVPRPAASAPLALAPVPGIVQAAATRLVDFKRPDAEFGHDMGFSGGQVKLQLAVYRHQRRQHALLEAGAAPFSGEPQQFGETVRRVAIGTGALTVRQTVIEKDGARLLVWRWYRQSGQNTASAAQLKLLLAVNRLLLQREDGAEFVVAIGCDDQPERAAAALAAFLALMMPAILQGADHAGVA